MNTIIVALIILLLLAMTKTEMFSFIDDSLAVFQKPIYPAEVSSPMGSYFSSDNLDYIGSLEPSCDNGYGYYNYDSSKKGINAKVIYNNEEYDAECSPYALNTELMVCSVKNKNNKLEFYGFMPKKC